MVSGGENRYILKDFSKQLLELRSHYNKVAGHKVFIQKSNTFLYTIKEKVEFEMKNTIPFT